MPTPSTPDLDEQGEANRFWRIAGAAEHADGHPPFSDQTKVDLRLGLRSALWIPDVAAAILSDREAELVVDPQARGRGNGTDLLTAILDSTTGDLLMWSHGDHPAARALAASHGFAPVRTLLQLENAVPSTEPDELSTGSINRFRPGVDEDEWVALNARTFAFHAEQGSVTRADLEELEGERWFDADDFLVARRDGVMVGYNWLKIEPGSTDGEIYVIGVDPDIQHSGLGGSLMAAGYARLRERGVNTVHLYVEGDNLPARALYRSLAFTPRAQDIQYLLPLPRP